MAFLSEDKRLYISREKIPKQYSYVLKTKVIKDILNDNNIDMSISIQYLKNNDILDVWFRYPYILYFRVGTVYRKDVGLARKLFREQVIPEFNKWLSIINNKKFNPNKDKRHFITYFVNGEIKIK